MACIGHGRSEEVSRGAGGEIGSFKSGRRKGERQIAERTLLGHSYLISRALTQSHNSYMTLKRREVQSSHNSHSHRFAKKGPAWISVPPRFAQFFMVTLHPARTR